MKRNYKYALIMLSLLCRGFGIEMFAQNIDSLWKVYYNKAQADTNRLNAINIIASGYRNTNPDTAIILAGEGLQLSEKLKQLKYSGNALKIIGIAHLNKGDYKLAIEFFTKAIGKYEKAGDKKATATCFNNMGVTYQYQANYPRALEYALKALKIREELGDKSGIGISYGNLGNVYSEMNNLPKSLEYNLKSVEISKETNDISSLARGYNNAGIIYRVQKNFTKALEFQLKALKYYEELGDANGLSGVYNSLGNIYADKTDRYKAFEYYFKELSICKEINEKKCICISYANISEVNNELGNYKLAIQYSDSGLMVSKEIGDIERARICYANLALAYAKTDNYKRAYENHIQFKALTDTIFNEENSKQLGDMKTRFEVEKKEAELKVKAEAQESINAEEKKRQRIVIILVLLVLVVVIVFSVFLYRRFKITQKQKHIIEIQKDEVFKQKHLVEEKQKEMIDSINYAKRIQYGLLASDNLLQEYLPEYFVLFNPKDIVSGDFYWATEYKDNFYLAVCDSTGHGVPGAFMSILNIGFLSEAIKEKDITKPNEILNYVRSRLIETISKEGQKDGMDCILIRLKSNNPFNIEYAAANNEPILLHNGEIIELAKDKMPVGKGEKIDSFTLHCVELQKGDSLILYTDGYADQFGGEKGKKFKYKPLNELLLANQQMSCNQQKDILYSTFINWRGNLEQVDDVTVVGIKM